MKSCPVCSTEYPESQRTCPKHGVVLVENREFTPGTIFRDTYRIERVLGRGGMGIVYLAEHMLLGQPRALKFLGSDMAMNPTAVQRFLREAKRAAEIGLYAPNIVKTLDMGQGEDGRFFICMEYVDGPSLEALLEQAPNGLPVDRTLSIVRDIAAGLRSAHNRGMVHRDIKPGNILLAFEDDTEVAKIADFGIVTAKDGDPQLTHITRAGAAQPLTPDYASPEQWKGVIPGRDLDGRTDLYALGCVFFQMLTGSVPFDKPGAEAHIRQAPPAPSKLQPALARYPELDQLVLRLMSKEREDRPANVRSFLEELSAVETAIARRDAALQTQPETIASAATQSPMDDNSFNYASGSSSTTGSGRAMMDGLSGSAPIFGEVPPAKPAWLPWNMESTSVDKQPYQAPMSFGGYANTEKQRNPEPEEEVDPALMFVRAVGLGSTETGRKNLRIATLVAIAFAVVAIILIYLFSSMN